MKSQSPFLNFNVWTRLVLAAAIITVIWAFTLLVMQ